MTDTLFLTPADLEDLTGYRQPAAQKRWLVQNNYAFDVRSDGRPNVLADQVRERQCKGVPAKTSPRLDRVG